MDSETAEGVTIYVSEITTEVETGEPRQVLKKEPATRITDAATSFITHCLRRSIAERVGSSISNFVRVFICLKMVLYAC